MDTIPLDRNESYWLLDDDLSRVCLSFTATELSTYPDYSQLKEHLATYASVTPEQICLTAGSDSIIEYISRTCIYSPKKVILPVPTFYGYESILARAHVPIIPISYTEENGTFVFPVEEILTHMEREDVGALFLCNPNNPLGCLIPDLDLKRIITKAQERNILLVSDEAYYEYGGDVTLLELVHRMPNVVIIRTFSKAFGLSGARIGYCIANPEIIVKLQSQILPWPIAHMSAKVAQTALVNLEAFTKRRDIYCNQRELFFDALQEMKELVVYPSKTNFLLVRLEHATRVQKILREHKILVADGEHMSRYKDAKDLLHSTLRIAIPSPEHMQRVLDVLRGAIVAR